jgi:hypothetical protein
MTTGRIVRAAVLLICVLILSAAAQNTYAKRAHRTPERFAATAKWHIYNKQGECEVRYKFTFSGVGFYHDMESENSLDYGSISGSVDPGNSVIVDIPKSGRRYADRKAKVSLRLEWCSLAGVPYNTSQLINYKGKEQLTATTSFYPRENGTIRFE